MVLTAGMIVAALAFGAPQVDRGIELEHVVSLGTADGAGSLAGEPLAVRQDSRGRYYVVERSAATQVMVFAPTGQPAGTIGRRGQGPGEFRRLADLAIGEGDTLWALDRGAGQVSVFSPNWEYSRSFPAPGARRLAVTPDGVVGLSGVFREGNVTRSLMIVRREGPGLVSGAEVVLDPRFPPPAPPIAGSGVGVVWQALEGSYSVAIWSSTGSRVAEIRVDSDRFRWPDEPSTLLPGEPRGPLIHAIEVGRDGTLQVLLSSDERDSPLEFHHRLEYVDVGGNVVRSVAVADGSYGFVAADLFFSYSEDAAGIPRIDIWRVHRSLSRRD